MPCWEQNTIFTTVFKVKAEILELALPQFIKEMIAVYGPKVQVTRYGDGGIRIDLTNDLLIEINSKTGEMDYAYGATAHVNALKRAYSAAVVRRVATRSRMKEKFTLKETGPRDFKLQRRR